MEPNTQLIVSLITVLMSGVVSAFVTYKLNNKKEVRNFQRTKLEACYDATHRFMRLLGSHHIVYLHALKGRRTWDEANDEVLADSNDVEREQWPTIEKIVNIYFPALNENLQELNEMKKDLSSCREIAKQAYLSQDNIERAIEVYNETLYEYDGVEQRFKSAIYDLAKKINT